MTRRSLWGRVTIRLYRGSHDRIISLLESIPQGDGGRREGVQRIVLTALDRYVDQDRDTVTLHVPECGVLRELVEELSRTANSETELAGALVERLESQLSQETPQERPGAQATPEVRARSSIASAALDY